MIRELIFPLPPLTRREIVYNYMDNLSTEDIHDANAIRTQITNPDMPLSQYQVIIPVAAHQEAAQIPVALEQYAHQMTDQPFSIILGLNSPSAEQFNPTIADSMKTIDDAKQSYPHLDIRAAMTFYNQPRIGTIRRNLWNAALLASSDEGAYTNVSDEVIGMNHDIDTISITPRYIQRVQQHYQKRQRTFTAHGMNAPLPAQTSVVKHAFSPDHPVISAGAYWTDFYTRSAGGWYEEGVIAPMSHYARSGGFTRDASTYETRPLAQDLPKKHVITGTTMQTSPRRYIERLQYGFDAIWTNDSFGDNDSCRTVATRPDMTLEQLEAVMLKDNHLSNTIALMAHAAVNTYLCHDSLRQLISPLSIEEHYAKDGELISTLARLTRQKIALASNVMARVLKSPRLTDHAIDLYTNNEYCDGIVSQHLFSSL
ncbi:MAG: hypothetical protein ACHQTE_00605 [Candidatus Saccharimonadales bacterium]